MGAGTGAARWGYTLYSSGQFDKAQLRNADMIRDRKRGQSVVIGDSDQATHDEQSGAT